MAAPVVVTCTCEACSTSRIKIQQIFAVLDVYGWLLDSYVVDFFQEQLWEQLPSSWRRVLQTVPPEEFGEWLAGGISCRRVWPLSLLALRQITKTLQVDRDHRDNKSILRCGQTGEPEFVSEDYHSKNATDKDLLATLKRHNNLFLKHVKMKKRHEIQRMAQVCADRARESNARCIVDVGAGVGHLARSVAFQHGLCVTCIEQDALLSQRARKWDRELSVSISKHLPDLPVNLPQHVSLRIEDADHNQIDTVESIQQTFSGNFSLDEGKSDFGIVGLHPCGDLAATLLRLYVGQCEARFICIVGCCYMKLTLKHETGSNGYPLSRFLSSRANRQLSYAALEVACHAIESYCDKLKAGSYEDLIVHAYRAALETILVGRSEQLRRTQVRNVRASRSVTFQQYCAAATADLESRLRPDDSDLQNPRVKYFLSQWRRIVIFGALRTMLAPLVETVVLLDRFLFLSENHLSPTLEPIFDARVSPRNFLLSSIKRL